MMKKWIMTMALVCTLNADYLHDIEADYQFGAGTDSTEKVVTVATLKQMYKGWLTYWKDGTRVKIYVRPYRDYVQKSMVVNLLGVSPSSFRETVEKNKNIQVIKANKMMQTLRNTKGSLGVLSAYEVIYNDGYGLVRVTVLED